ncbi:MAG: hypothetical protein LBE08_09335, partial [Bifidobacteriaceae bacterium]|nr:hypothetical protein [Bifidobacteriaceae bacterium]
MTTSYEPFPAFADWSQAFNPAVVDRYAARLSDVRRAAPGGALDRARDVALRSAAVDSGAIEGLYTTDRGFTKTVA